MIDSELGFGTNAATKSFIKDNSKDCWSENFVDY